MRLYYLFFSLLICWAGHAKACNQPLVVAYNGDWEPYFFQFAPHQYEGVDFHLLNAVLKQMDCPLNVLSMTENRSIIELSKGTFDISLGASYTDERNVTFHYSKPYRLETVGLAFRQRDNLTEATTLEELLAQGATVGLNLSGYFGERVEALKKSYPEQFVHGFSLPQRIALLANNQIDAIVDDRLALCIQLQSIQQPKVANTAIELILSNQILHSDNVHFMFSRKTVEAQFVQQFNQQLSASIAQEKPTYPAACHTE